MPMAAGTERQRATACGRRRRWMWWQGCVSAVVCQHVRSRMEVEGMRPEASQHGSSHLQDQVRPEKGAAVRHDPAGGSGPAVRE
jgi:hypothetical protein